MLEWILENLSWIWKNISYIDSTISIIVVISGVIAPMVIRLRNDHISIKNFKLDKQTKRSMKHYIPSRGFNIDPCDQENIDNDSGFELIPFFMKKFKDPKSQSQYFIILADSGMGKTTFLLKLFFKYKRKILKKYNIVLIPLSQNHALDEIKKVKNKQRTILLLDSFDEDSYAMEDYEKRLEVICKETESFYKIIITCRTQFFPDSENEPRFTGNKNPGIGKKGIVFDKYYILPFSDSEISRYLKKKYNYYFQKDKFERALKLTLNCPQLVIRPMLLSYIDDLIEDQEKEYDNVFEIYDQMVSKWIEREALKNNNLLYEFSERVAEYMYFNRTVNIGRLEIEKLCKEYNIKLRNNEARAQSLLNRNANGVYKFAHKSILEFFLSKKAFKEEEFRKIVISNGFNGYDMLELFIKEKSLAYIQDLLHVNSKELKSGIFRYLILSEVDLSEISFIDCNFKGCIFSKVNFKSSNFDNVNFFDLDLGESIFSGVELRNIKFANVDLKKCEFCNAHFANAYIERVNLEGANLEGAKTEGIDLRKANLRMASLNGAILEGVNLIGEDLSELNLSNINFQSAKLAFADLTKSILVNSNLINADLRGTVLEGASLSKAIFDEDQIDFLKNKYNLADTMVFLKKKGIVVGYREYKIWKNLLMEDDEFE